MKVELKVNDKTVQVEMTEGLNLELGMREEKNVTIRSIILSIL